MLLRYRLFNLLPRDFRFRLRAAWNVLRSRPVIYRVKLHRDGSISPLGPALNVTACETDGTHFRGMEWSLSGGTVRINAPISPNYWNDDGDPVTPRHTGQEKRSG